MISMVNIKWLVLICGDIFRGGLLNPYGLLPAFNFDMKRNGGWRFFRNIQIKELELL
jgi:hypothetical protein